MHIKTFIYFFFLDSFKAISILECIIGKQPNLNLKDKSGKTALDTAIEFMSNEIVEESSSFYEPKRTKGVHDRMKFMTLSQLMIRLLDAGANIEPALLNRTLIHCSLPEIFKG